MKKLLVVLLAVAMVFAFAACQKEAPVDTPADDTPTDETPAGIPADQIKVGHIHINDEADMGYSYAHIQGIKGMQAALGLTDEQVVGKYNIGEDSSCDTALRELVEAGCNIIFCDSFGHEDYMLEVAQEYPDVQFVHATGYQAAGYREETSLDNMSNFFGKVYEARYLTGIVAGMITESNTLGYVTAQQYAECISGFTAFYLGALSVNPDATMNVMYTNTWYDVSLESQAAQALIDSGADVLSQHADSTATQTTAEANGIYGIGYNSDMTAAAPNANIADAVWDWSPAYIHFVELMINGEEIPSDYCGDLANGMVDILINDALLDTFANADEIRAAVQTAKDAIIAGELKVFAGPLYDNQGNLLVEEGSYYPESEEASAPSWDKIVKGVTVLE